jgi:hypothetical protein
MRGGSVLATAAVLLLAGCGGSSSSSSFATICNRWAAEARRDAASAGQYGQQFAVQFQGVDGPAKLASIRQHLAVAYYRLGIAKDLHGPWRQAAACPTPGA